MSTGLRAAAPLGDLRIVRYGNMEEAKAAWLDLESEASVYPFQRYAWLEAWQETLGKGRGAEPRPLLLERRSTGEAALLPLCATRRAGLRRLSWMGDGVSDYKGPLVRGSFDGETIAAAARGEARRAGCDFIELDNMPELLADRSANPVIGTGARRLHYAAHGLELPDSLDAYLKERLSSKERYNLRRAEKKLAELGALRFARAESDEERKMVTEAMIDQKRARYRATGATDNFAEEAYGRFYRVAALRPHIVVHLSALYLDQKIIATHWGVADAASGTMFFLMPTFDAAYERFSPGVIFLMRFIEHCAGLGLRRLDFTVGDEVYKDKWCSDETGLYSIVGGLSGAGLLFAGAVRLVEAAKSGPLLPLAREAKKSILRLRA